MPYIISKILEIVNDLEHKYLQTKITSIYQAT